MWTLRFVLVGVLLGAAQASYEDLSAFKCHEGNHTTVTLDFPDGTMKCEATSTKTCVEKRRKNWETNPGFFELYFGCGKCGTFNDAEIECRECASEGCNSEYAAEFKKVVTKFTLCYNTLNTTIGQLPVPVFCPYGQKCTSSADPNDKEHYLVGCQSHCSKLNWPNCQNCDSDLCNLADNSNATVEPIVMAKVELPKPPPSSSPSTFGPSPIDNTDNMDATLGSTSAATVTALPVPLTAQVVAMASAALTYQVWPNLSD